MTALPEPPITYVHDFVPDPDEALRALRDELTWERRPDAPRGEYYANDNAVPYTYGRGRGQRTYHPRPWHSVMLKLRERIEAHLGCGVLDVCFLNRYENAREHLGWHADDSPEMDDARPIAVVSLGAERPIEFRPIAARTLRPAGFILGHGSLCVMHAGMQDTWEHRIGKASFQCGLRISLTYRGYVDPFAATAALLKGASS